MVAAGAEYPGELLTLHYSLSETSMQYSLRLFQARAVRSAVDFLASAGPGDRRCYAAPTGSGKGVIEVVVHSLLPGAWLLSPKLEIITGLLQKAGLVIDGMSEQGILDLAMSYRITTPLRLRNRLLAGEIPAPPALIFDEGHHDLASTWQDVHTLCGCAPAICFTATPYRGTPRGTAAFRELWGPPHWLITFMEAESKSYVTMPNCVMLPLVDDDEIAIANGELVASQVNEVTRSRLADLVERCRRYAGWDKATMFACPSGEIARELAERLDREGMRASLVLQDTPYIARKLAFEDCITRRTALVQVSVIGEGVDLPIRRLIDLKPTLSPVLWLQQFGRITRPGGGSEYVCTNRNLFRHAYTLDGVVSNATLLAAQDAFPTPSTRSAGRAVGLEVIGKLKAAVLPLRGGLQGLLYALTSVVDNAVVEYACIVHPAYAEAFWASRSRPKGKPGEAITYGKWQVCAAPEDVIGYASVPAKPLTEKMEAWWARAAGRYGLDPTAEVDRKTFQALPVLSDTGRRL